MSEDIYPGGVEPFLQRFRKSKRPFVDPASYLPAADCDLSELAAQIVIAPDVDFRTLEKASIERRHTEYCAEFAGQTKLFYLHALLIAMLRRNDAPVAAQTLFMRLWAEHGDTLANGLPIRWKISAVTTFADCGTNMDQRSLGMGLSILFDCIKLHESERRLSGQPSDTPFETVRRSKHSGLAFDLSPYSVSSGDLDRNMLARLWGLAEQDSVIEPLAKSLLSGILTDQRTVFARLQALKWVLAVEKAVKKK